MVVALGTLLILAFIFAIVYEQVTWVTNFKIWDKVGDDNQKLMVQWTVSLDAMFNHWGPWITKDYIMNWTHFFFILGIMFLYKVILFKFILSFITDSLRASNAVLVPADQDIKLQHLTLTIEVMRFMRCMKKRDLVYPKDDKDTTKGLDNLWEPVDWTSGYYQDSEWINRDKAAEPGDEYIYCVFEKEDKPVAVEKTDPIQALRDNVMISLDKIYNKMELMEKKVNSIDIDEIIEAKGG
jgi:hypothetical protein